MRGEAEGRKGGAVRGPGGVAWDLVILAVDHAPSSAAPSHPSAGCGAGGVLSGHEIFIFDADFNANQKELIALTRPFFFHVLEMGRRRVPVRLVFMPGDS